MDSKTNKKRFRQVAIPILVISIFIIIALAAYLGMKAISNKPTTYEVGSVKVISNGKEILPFQSWDHGLHEGICGDAIQISQRGISNKLKTIDYSEDFEIIVEGNPHYIGYAMYIENFEKFVGEPGLYPTLNLPNDAGLYIVRVQVTWGTDTDNTAYDYVFKLNILPSSLEQSANNTKSFQYSEVCKGPTLTFDQAIEASNCAVTATFIGEYIYDEYNELEFKVNEVIYGYVPEKDIKVFQMNLQNRNVFDNHVYKETETYTLILERLDSLFYDHPRYLFVSDVFIPISDKTANIFINGESIAATGHGVLSSDNVNQYLRNSGRSKPNHFHIRKDKDIPFTTATDLSEIIASSDYVMEITVIDMVVEGTIANSNTYSCDIANVLKGSTPTEKYIWVTFLKNSVNIGEKYIVILNRLGDDSLIYAQSSKNSVISLDDKASIEQINSIVVVD